MTHPSIFSFSHTTFFRKLAALCLLTVFLINSNYVSATTNAAATPINSSPQYVPHAQSTTQGQTPELVLNDIHTPKPISDFPIAIGWWILIASIIALFTYSIKKIITNKRLNKDKKIALKSLITHNNINFDEALLLLKWVAMQYFDRASIAKLHGNHFQLFLSSQLPEKHKPRFEQLTETAFKQQYQLVHQQSEVDNFKEGVALWIKQALPPKRNFKESLTGNTTSSSEVKNS